VLPTFLMTTSKTRCQTNIPDVVLTPHNVCTCQYCPVSYVQYSSLCRLSFKSPNCVYDEASFCANLMKTFPSSYVLGFLMQLELSWIVYLVPFRASYPSKHCFRHWLPNHLWKLCINILRDTTLTNPIIAKKLSPQITACRYG